MTPRRDTGWRARTIWAGLWLGAMACGGPAEPVVSEQGLTVGVIPYAEWGSNYCLQGPERESAYVKMDDENDTHCSYETGDFGAGIWVTPETAKYPIPEECDEFRTHTELSFCRVTVAPDAFRPLTTDPKQTEQFYALLKFGNECPRHSIEVTKTIVNEDADNQNEPISTADLAEDLLFPNRITGDTGGNRTQLHFCYFTTAPTEQDLMQSFPDLGIPYAVFHDFDGQQPAWVIRKRWKRSDDSNQATEQDSYAPDPEASEGVKQFLDIIENQWRANGFDTYFDMARVR